LTRAAADRNRSLERGDNMSKRSRRRHRQQQHRRPGAGRARAAVREMLNVGRDRETELHPDVRRLGFFGRLFHRRVRRHMTAILIGVAIMLTGSTMATQADHVQAVPHSVWDALAYLIHGIGSLPILGRFELLWQIIVAE
jgi:hypothetical protein